MKDYRLLTLLYETAAILSESVLGFAEKSRIALITRHIKSSLCSILSTEHNDCSFEEIEEFSTREREHNCIIATVYNCFTTVTYVRLSHIGS